MHKSTQKAIREKLETVEEREREIQDRLKTAKEQENLLQRSLQEQDSEGGFWSIFGRVLGGIVTLGISEIVRND